MTYDGHGRLETRKLPIESAACSYEYNADDTVQQRTDPRGATATFTYNARHLLTGIDYHKPQNAAAEGAIGEPNVIPDAPDVEFGYDEAGNRVWMTDGRGRVDYVYDTWSRMASETRVFNNLSGSWPVSYTYNLADESWGGSGGTVANVPGNDGRTLGDVAAGTQRESRRATGRDA